MAVVICWRRMKRSKVKLACPDSTYRPRPMVDGRVQYRERATTLELLPRTSRCSQWWPNLFSGCGHLLDKLDGIGINLQVSMDISRWRDYPQLTWPTGQQLHAQPYTGLVNRWWHGYKDELVSYFYALGMCRMVTSSQKIAIVSKWKPTSSDRRRESIGAFLIQRMPLKKEVSRLQVGGCQWSWVTDTVR